MNRRSLPQGFGFALACLALFAVSACSDRSISAPSRLSADPDHPRDDVLTALVCNAKVAARTVTCGSAPVADANDVSREIIGGNNVYVKVTSTNVSYVADVFQFDVTVQNLMNEGIGTPNGTVVDADGITVFMNQELTATGGSGLMSVLNADGSGTFTGTNQPFFRYPQLLVRNQISASKTWQFSIPATVTSFSFNVYLSVTVQPLLVINEILTNTAGAIPEAEGEWFELYNAGTLSVNLQDLVIADSAQSGRRPYHLIASSVVVPPGGYVTLGAVANTTTNGGVAIDYAYGTSSVLAFANSLDAVKISRVWLTDTLTLDRAQYANPGISSQSGISRELRNPALDNSNIDGGNWADAGASAVYGPGGRGTPNAQNSTFTP